jgi:predicted outer membrane repeat protein
MTSDWYRTKKSENMKIQLFILCFFIMSNLSAQVFVDIDATGTADGTSWENAFTDLQDAIEVTPNGGIIWVAEGIYFPRTPTNWPSSIEKTFYINRHIKLFGGFQGNETVLEERDWETHQTILSGDLNQDDIPQDFESNRSDNVINVMRFEEVSDYAELDGFIIEHGHANVSQIDVTGERGGGIFSYGAVQIRNCVIRENYAQTYGGGLYFRHDECSGALVENCVFVGNYCEASGGGMIVAVVQSIPVRVRNSAFLKNTANEGGGGFYSNDSKSILENNIFTDNNSGFWGGGVFFLAELNGGALQTITLDSCSFYSNQSSSGGGLDFRAWNVYNSITVTNSIFEDNIADLGLNGPGGGGFRGGGMNIDFLSELTGANVNLHNNVFNNNFTAGHGAGLSITHGSSNSNNVQLMVSECQFESNQAEGSGGGFFYLNSGGDGELKLDQCAFFENTALDEGGAVLIEPHTPNISVQIDACHFMGNDAVAASAISLKPESSTNLGLENITMEVSNSLFTDHAGASLIQVERMPLQLLNCTLADNQATTGLLAAAQANCWLQNNIFAGTAEDNIKIIEDGVVGSWGGNLMNDFSFANNAVVEDYLGEDPEFETGTYQLTIDSKGIDGGILPDEPATYDFLGNPRIQGGCIDIGAFESPYDSGNECATLTTDAKEEVIFDGEYTFYPNPTQDFLNVEGKDDLRTGAILEIVHANGQVLHQQILEQSTSRIPVHSLPAGIYTARIQHPDGHTSVRFIKL